MISIITAIHNQLDFNKLFLTSLKKNSVLPYEVIIVDNHSTDGSADFFEDNGCTVIRNPSNHCYPESQNMGMKLAKYDYLAFLNNDVYVGPAWDKNAIDAMRIHGLDVASLGSWECVEDPYQRRAFNQRWKWLRKGRRYLDKGPEELKIMMDRLYGNDFESWCEDQFKQFAPRVNYGLCGSAVITTRQAWDKLGGDWDVQMEAADWDLHLRTTKYAFENSDMRPPHIIPWALHHHFSRVTFRNKPEPRACTHKHIGIQEKWNSQELEKYGPKPLLEQGIYVKFRRFIKRFRISKVVDREKVD